MGKTFTSTAGVGLTGTIVNRGALNWNPTSNATETVQPGYYSGGTLDSSGAYNKGMEDADARVNEDSKSYKEGVIEGKKKNEFIYTANWSTTAKITVTMDGVATLFASAGNSSSGFSFYIYHNDIKLDGGTSSGGSRRISTKELSNINVKKGDTFYIVSGEGTMTFLSAIIIAN